MDPSNIQREEEEYNHDDENQTHIAVIKATKKITEDVDAKKRAIKSKFDDIQKPQYADLVLLDCFVLALFYAIGVFMEVPIGDATVEGVTVIFSGLVVIQIVCIMTSYIPVFILFRGQRSKVKPCTDD